jgi:superfamily II DNA or RNA helicase
MPFTELKLRRSYDSYSSDLTKEFFNPALSEAKIYLRAAAYFSSLSLRAISKGLASLLSKGGEMKLIVAILVSDADYEAILEGKKLVNEEILKIFSDESAMSEMLSNDSVNALCKLVASKRLDIKFIISKKGIFHMKFGVFEDHEGNLLSFSGSLNETYEGYQLNGEEIKVFRGWVPGESNYVNDDYSKFYSYWESRLPVEEAIISDLPALRDYQEAALEFFDKSGFRAILEMATGTGKTLVALHCMKLLYRKLGKKFTIIAVPTDALAYQWQKEWKNFFGFLPFVYDYDRKKDFLSYCIYSKEDGVAIMTYNSLSRRVHDDFLPIIGDGIALIADEAHWLGAPTFSKAMADNFKYRLGLSATPERMFDEEGTGRILEFFGENEFEYGLSEAISDGYLSEFSYYPQFCKLTPEEILEYGNLTKNAVNAREPSNDDQISPQEIALIKRAKVVKKAECKFSIFEEIIKQLHDSGNLDHLLVFFEDRKQLLEAQRALINIGVPFNTIDATTNDLERSASSARLDSGEISCLLSMRVMDEGVNIPSAKREILMASSSNERQYIQRAGRILRIYVGKGKAEIFDLIAFAEQTDCPEWLWKYEINAIKKEIRRAMYFCKAASNKPDCIRHLHSFGEKLNISIWE